MKKREPVLIHMEILASLFQSPKLPTRLAQSIGVNYARLEPYTSGLLAKGLIVEKQLEGLKVLAITQEGYTLYQEWLEVWSRLPV